MKQPQLRAQGPAKLERSVTLAEAIIYGVGVILGAGIYALIGRAAGIAGNAVWLSFLLAAVVASFTALSYAELSSLFAKEAAEFNYMRSATGSELIAFIVGYATLFSGIISAAAVSLGFAEYFSGLFNTPIVLSAIALVAVLTLINLAGIKESVTFNILATLVEVGGLLIIIILGIGFIGSVNYFETPTAAANIFGFISPITAAAALIFFAYLGFEDIANISEEVVDARSNVPKALLVSLLIATVIYILVAVVAVSIVPYTELAVTAEGELGPLALVAARASGGFFGSLLSFMALFATANTVLILLICSSRIIYGMASAGSLPPFLSRVHSCTKTPYLAILLVAVVSAAFIFIGDIQRVAFITNVGVFIVFFAVNSAAVILRFTQPDAKRTFKVPLSIGPLPIIPSLGAISCLFMLSQVGGEMAVLGLKVPLLLFSLLMLSTAIPIHFLLKRMHKG